MAAATEHEGRVAAASHSFSGLDLAPTIPDLYTDLPSIHDDLQTTTSKAQDFVADNCRPYLNASVDGSVFNKHGVPRLLREKHIPFVQNNLGGLPGGYVGADASRPWFLYWCLNSLAVLGQNITAYRKSLVQTVSSMQNASGGFGGGHGQYSHLATSYAALLSLALVGGDECYRLVDRRAMWQWLCLLKQPDGGFQMTVGGEKDVRGAYCAAVIISLLNLPLNLAINSPAYVDEHSTLFTKLPEFVQRCQTFEGGISDQPDAEAHGAYAFCALGCLALLDTPSRIIPQYLDLPRFISWLSARQYAPEGGFSGRTNKLVDGCYSHWVGACWPLVEAGLGRVGGGRKSGRSSGDHDEQDLPHLKSPTIGLDQPRSPDEDTRQNESALYSHEGLIRYIMCCCQDLSKRGGLRDKPGKQSDAYHTCYVLSGLSSSQNSWTLPDADDDDSTWLVSTYDDEAQIFEEEDRVVPLHPIYAIPESCATAMRAYFSANTSF